MAAADGGSERRLLVAQLWDEHRHAPFPGRLRGDEPAGVEVVMVDADVAGCVGSWLSNAGSLDPRRMALLRGLRADLDRVLPLLDDVEERRYVERLLELARLVLDARR